MKIENKLEEFNMGNNIDKPGCYLKFQLMIRSVAERILHPISWAKLS